MYFSANLAKPLDQLDGSVSSELEGNPPIWITRIKGRYRDDLYANNAQILQDRSNYIQMNHQQKQQVLHVIDKVLVPVRSANKDTTQIYNPDAFHFLNQSENLDVGDHRLRYVIYVLSSSEFIKASYEFDNFLRSLANAKEMSKIGQWYAFVVKVMNLIS